MNTSISTIDPSIFEQFKNAFKPSQPYLNYNRIRLSNKKIGDDGQLNPEYGKLFATTQEDGNDVKTEIDWSKASFVILTSRVAIKSEMIVMPDGKKKFEYEIPEVADGEPITVYRSGSKMKDVVAQGYYRDLKEQYRLKYACAVYVMLRTSESEKPTDKIFRWEIGGKALTEYFNIRNDLYDSMSKGEPLSFKIKELVEENNGATWYNVPKFEKSSMFPIESVVPMWKVVNDYFANLNTVKHEQISSTPQIAEPANSVTEPIREDIVIDGLPF